MHISDIAIECANDCKRLAEKATDRSTAERLAKIAQRLLEAARHDSELEAEGEATACACSAGAVSE